MAERVSVREIDNDEGKRLLRMVRRSSGSVVTWRQAQMVLLSAQGMDVAGIAKVTFTSADRVRDVIRNFNADGFDSLRPRYAGGRPPKFDLEQRAQIKSVALARPTDCALPFSTWSLSKLADYLVAQGVVDDISHEGLRILLRDEGVSFPGRQDLMRPASSAKLPRPPSGRLRSTADPAGISVPATDGVAALGPAADPEPGQAASTASVAGRLAPASSVSPNPASHPSQPSQTRAEAEFR